jgi:pinin
MFGALLGTLEKFRQEDKKLSGSESFQRRSEQLKRTEQKAQEESERLRQQEREAMAEKRKADLTLRAKLSAEAESKQLELLFLQWAEHHTRLSSFIRTKAGPAIYYLPVKRSEKTDQLLQEAQEDLEAWKVRSREELAEQQKQITELSEANLNAEIEKWKNGPPGRNKAPGASLGAESNNEGGVGDTVVEEPKEGNEVVEDEDDETGAMLIEEDEERVTVGDTEVNKLVSV